MQRRKQTYIKDQVHYVTWIFHADSDYTTPRLQTLVSTTQSTQASLSTQEGKINLPLKVL